MRGRDERRQRAKREWIGRGGGRRQVRRNSAARLDDEGAECVDRQGAAARQRRTAGCVDLPGKIDVAAGEREVAAIAPLRQPDEPGAAAEAAVRDLDQVARGQHLGALHVELRARLHDQGAGGTAGACSEVDAAAIKHAAASIADDARIGHEDTADIEQRLGSDPHVAGRRRRRSLPRVGAGAADTDGAGMGNDAAEHRRRDRVQADDRLRVGHDAGAAIDEDAGARRHGIVRGKYAIEADLGQGQADRLAQAVRQKSYRREIVHDRPGRGRTDAGGGQEGLLPQNHLRAGGNGRAPVEAGEGILREACCEE